MNDDDLFDPAFVPLANAPWYLSDAKGGVFRVKTDTKDVVLVFTDNDLASVYAEQLGRCDLFPRIVAGQEKDWVAWLAAESRYGATHIAFDHVVGERLRTIPIERAFDEGRKQVDAERRKRMDD